MDRRNLKVLSLCIIIVLTYFINAFAETERVIATIALEASGEPFAGQVAVAKVIRNRAQKRGLSYDEVVTQKLQFSCWSRDSRGNIRQARKRPLSENEINRARKAWIESAKPHYDSFTADLYYNPELCKPSWNFTKTIFIAEIGSHRFLEEIR